MSLYRDWEDGNVSDEIMFRALCSDVGEVTSQMAPLERELAGLKDQLSRVVDHMGGKAELAGFGKVQITSPSKTVAYDKAQLDKLVEDLVLMGEGQIAQRILATKKESARAGGLRIEREKGTK